MRILHDGRCLRFIVSSSLYYSQESSWQQQSVCIDIQRTQLPCDSGYDGPSITDR